jgi:hypothetical protein
MAGRDKASRGGRDEAGHGQAGPGRARHPQKRRSSQVGAVFATRLFALLGRRFAGFRARGSLGRLHLWRTEDLVRRRLVVWGRWTIKRSILAEKSGVEKARLRARNQNRCKCASAPDDLRCCALWIVRP